MSELGRLAIVLGFIVAIWGSAASILGGFRRDRALVVSGTHAAYAFSALVGLAVFALLQLLLARDFNVEYVASYGEGVEAAEEVDVIAPEVEEELRAVGYID